MAQEDLYGIAADQETRKERFVRAVDEDSLASFCGSTFGFLACMLALLIVLVWHPGLWLPGLVCGVLVIGLRVLGTWHSHLPMRLPLGAAGRDYNSRTPGGGFRRASGLFYLGNALPGNEELWISKEDILTHMLVLGTTGSGKTETLVSLCYNFLTQGSGVIYVDPKAAPRLGVQLWTMARLLGRDDDFLLINYMAPKESQKATSALRQSNTQNPFAFGDANTLTQLLFALMPVDPAGGESIFSSSAQTLISGLLFVLVERRNKGIEPLSIETIRTYLLDTQKIDALARDPSISETARLALVAALSTVGWDAQRAVDKQSRNFYEQYSYARAYFGRALSLLVDNYGHIFRVHYGEVDVVDVIVNRRIFVTLIPSMDKDPKELKSLGQICLASVRNACAVGLGQKVQGTLADVLGSLPTEARVPFGIVVDEYAAIETPGFEILLTQGRGLGMAVTVASQDFAGIQRASSAAAEQIVSNCKVKLFMTSEDPRATTDLVQKLAGTGYVLQSTGYTKEKGGLAPGYVEADSVRPQRMERVDFRDLQRQIEGEVTISFKGELIRGRTFYANPPLAPTQSLRLGVFLQCGPPDLCALDAALGDVARLIGAFSQKITQKTAQPAGEPDPLLAKIGEVMREQRAHVSAVDLGITMMCRVSRFAGHAEPPLDDTMFLAGPSLHGALQGFTEREGGNEASCDFSALLEGHTAPETEARGTEET